MKRKIIFGLALILIGLIAFLPNSQAATSDFFRIAETNSVDIADFQIKNLTFKNYATTSTRAYGLYGEITNTSSNNLTVYTTVSFYDKDYNLLTTIKNKQNINEKAKSNYNLMSNIDNSVDISKIVYYKLDITSDEMIVDNTNPSLNNSFEYKSYVINSYNVDIKVNKNKILDITEDIGAYFYTPKHGIIRKIPLMNNLKRLDGSSSKLRAKISKVDVNDIYEATKNGNDYELKIGSAYDTVEGQKNYRIKYTYNLGNDNNKNYDELYFISLVMNGIQVLVI